MTSSSRKTESGPIGNSFNKTFQKHMYFKIYFTTIWLLFICNFSSIGQTHELQVRVPLNFLSFSGSGASSQTYNVTPVNNPKSPHVDNPYGKSGLIGYGLGIAFQRNTKANLIYGISSSLEKNSTKILTSNGIIYDNEIIRGEGSNKLDLVYWNFQPFIGLTALNKINRTEFKLVSDFGLLINSKEQLTFKSNEETFKFQHDREHPIQDIRIGLGLAVHIKHFAINLEYLQGVVNFDYYRNHPLVDVPDFIYSRILRLGMSYVIWNTKEDKK